MQRLATKMGMQSSSSSTPHDDESHRSLVSSHSHDNEHPPLPTPPTQRRRRFPKRSFFRSRFTALTTVLFSILFVAFGIGMVWLNRKMVQVQTELAEEKLHVEKLDGILVAQAATIRRFNSSVTNEDVLKRMKDLQEKLESTELRLNHSIQEQQLTVTTQLKATLDELHQAVSEAEEEIHAEVQTVKGDVETYVRTTQDQFSMENDFMIYQLAGTFTLIGSLISMWHMTAHLRKFNQPFVQRKILAILWMCPIYSVTSWLCLVFDPLQGYLEIIKDCYEAYVIYTFLSFLIAVLGRGDRGAVVDLLTHHADHLQPPVTIWGLVCCCCQRWLPCSSSSSSSSSVGEYHGYPTARSMADAVLLQCQIFAMQFVLLKPLTSIATFVVNKMHLGEGFSSFDYRSPHFYLLIVENVSVFLAFSGLLKFYHAVQDDLAWCRPWPKFLCIKGVVFMTFWQGLAISILANSSAPLNNNSNNNGNVVQDPTEATNSEEEWASKAQDFLICLEMLIFSIAHFYVFPTEEWMDGYRPTENKDARFGDNLALRDFVSDLRLVLGKKSHAGTEKGELDARTASFDESVDVERGLSDIIKKYDSIDPRLPTALPGHDVESDTIEKAAAFRRLSSVNSTLDKEDEGVNVYAGSTASTDLATVAEDEALDVNDLRRAFAMAFLSPEMQDSTARLLKSTIQHNQEKKAEDEEEQPPRRTFAWFGRRFFGSGGESWAKSDHGKKEPAETTGLLSATSAQEKEEKVRPSIFASTATTTASRDCEGEHDLLSKSSSSVYEESNAALGEKEEEADTKPIAECCLENGKGNGSEEETKSCNDHLSKPLEKLEEIISFSPAEGNSIQEQSLVVKSCASAEVDKEDTFTQSECADKHYQNDILASPKSEQGDFPINPTESVDSVDSPVKSQCEFEDDLSSVTMSETATILDTADKLKPKKPSVSAVSGKLHSKEAAPSPSAKKHVVSPRRKPGSSPRRSVSSQSSSRSDKAAKREKATAVRKSSAIPKFGEKPRTPTKSDESVRRERSPQVESKAADVPEKSGKVVPKLTKKAGVSRSSLSGSKTAPAPVERKTTPRPLKKKTTTVVGTTGAAVKIKPEPASKIGVVKAPKAGKLESSSAKREKTPVQAAQAKAAISSRRKEKATSPRSPPAKEGHSHSENAGMSPSAKPKALGKGGMNVMGRPQGDNVDVENETVSPPTPTQDQDASLSSTNGQNDARYVAIPTAVQKEPTEVEVVHRSSQRAETSAQQRPQCEVPSASCFDTMEVMGNVVEKTYHQSQAEENSVLPSNSAERSSSVTGTETSSFPDTKVKGEEILRPSIFTQQPWSKQNH